MTAAVCHTEAQHCLLRWPGVFSDMHIDRTTVNSGRSIAVRIFVQTARWRDADLN
jgi:hypothetical protein